MFNVVEPVERWQLSDLETALGAFIARHDYRDYYQRHGGNGSLTLYGARNFSLTGSYGEERWTSREPHNPFSLFNGERDWRPNPLVDEGLFHVGDLELNFDTRTDPSDPWSGWFLNADLEHGRGNIIRGAPVSAGRATDAEKSDYTRGFFDFRRYNRLGPTSRLNMRLVLGGWMGGDALPLERRLSVDGPGALPGFGFRSAHTGIDVGNCNAGVALPGVPAECDRIALAQVEYRGDLRLNFNGRWEDWPRHYRSSRSDLSWVLFADAGRGWRVGSTDAPGLTYDRSTIPPLSTFRTDVGVGLDLAGIGIYCAKSLSSTSEPANFFVRLRHRF
jgi:outer membrane protein assembly factor BamA